MKNSIPGIMLSTAMACAAMAPAQAGVVAADATYGVVDGSQEERILTVATHGIIGDLNVSLEFAKCDGPPLPVDGNNCLATGNAFNDEIYFLLTSPSGITVRLIDVGTYFEGTRGSGRVSLLLDDEAAAAVGGPLLASGTFRAVQGLSAFDGMDMFGNWRLTVGDSDADDPLTYFRSSLAVDTLVPPKTVPEPGSICLFGLGMLAFWRAARRAR
jgi:hypothetical protein